MVGRFSHSSKNHIHRRFRSSIPYRSVGGSWENEKAGAGEVGLGRSTSAHDDSIDGFNLAGKQDYESVRESVRKYAFYPFPCPCIFGDIIICAWAAQS